MPADRSCVSFLQWALPQLGMRWEGFRRVRRQVCRRIEKRIALLELDGFASYRDWLQTHDEEWDTLDRLCRVTISRFFRDRRLFEHDLPAFADRCGGPLVIWSAGCASGEEPYSVLIALHPRAVSLVATEASAHMLARARAGRYPHGTLRELDETARRRWFKRDGDDYVVDEALRREVRFLQQDVRREMPEGPFDVVLCRNLVLTYFDAGTQRAVLERIAARMRPGALFVIGAHERMPEGAPFSPHGGCCFLRADGHAKEPQ